MNRQSSEDIRLVLNNDPKLGKVHSSVEAFVCFDHEMTYEVENLIHRWIDKAAPFKALRRLEWIEEL